MANEGFDRKKLKEIWKKGVNVHKEHGERYLNVVVYSYDGGTPKVRIQPSNKNTNPNAESNKQWINVHSITGLTRDEVSGVIALLKEALYKM